MLRFTNVDTQTCRMMMIERAPGVSSVAVHERNSWLRWLFAPDVEWIECAVDPGCSVKMHADASSKLSLVARIHMPLVHKLHTSKPTKCVLHFQHDDDTQVYQYRITLDTGSYCTANGRRAEDGLATDLLELALRCQMTQSNSVHDGVQIVALGKHILRKESGVWASFHAAADPPVVAVTQDSEGYGIFKSESAEVPVPFIQTTSNVKDDV